MDQLIQVLQSTNHMYKTEIGECKKSCNSMTNR